MDLHLRLSGDYDSTAKKEIMEAFIQRCMSFLKTNSDQSNSVLNIIQILSEFLDRYEGKRPIKPEVKPNMYQ